MRRADTLRAAAQALFENPARTLLTLLGVIIGVACVVSMAAIGAGAQHRVSEAIGAFGANVLVVNPGATNKDGVSSASGGEKSLTVADAEAIGALTTIREAAPTDFGNRDRKVDR